jgi:hypothetical protein
MAGLAPFGEDMLPTGLRSRMVLTASAIPLGASGNRRRVFKVSTSDVRRPMDNANHHRREPHVRPPAERDYFSAALAMMRRRPVYRERERRATTRVP